MKIAVEGSIINTKHIIEITPIDEWSQANGYEPHVGFKVKLINKKKLVIKRSAYIEGPHKDKQMKLLNNLRDQLIEVWTKNQSTIPQFKL